MTIRIGVIGLGYWGRNYPRVLRDITGVGVGGLVDTGEALERARKAWPDAPAFDDLDAFLDSGAADAAIVATPASTHAEVAIRCMEAGLHVLVEKPLATTFDDARRIEERAKELEKVVVVGHTFLYSPRVSFIQQYVESGALGHVRYLYSRRLNLGKVRNDVDALWNFGPHDVSIAMHVLGARPVKVAAHALYALDRPLADVSFVHLEFPGRTWANLHMSWLDPRRVREMTIVGSNGMLFYDDTEPTEPVRIYESVVQPDEPGITFQNWADFQFAVRPGNITIPHIPNEEPLARLCKHFAACVRDGVAPVSPASQGVDVVEVLEAASRSASRSGVEIRLVPS